jgi:peptide deformylase
MSLIIDPHNIISRLITPDDYARVKEEADRIYEEAFSPKGIFKKVYAVAHQQVTDKDPLRFFILRSGLIVMNPEIIRHTKTTVGDYEACLSFPNNYQILVQRWYKITVKYEKLNNDLTVYQREEHLKGLEARIFQHEMAHFDCNYIYEQ